MRRYLPLTLLLLAALSGRALAASEQLDRAGTLSQLVRLVQVESSSGSESSARSGSSAARLLAGGLPLSFWLDFSAPAVCSEGCGLSAPDAAAAPACERRECAVPSGRGRMRPPVTRGP